MERTEPDISLKVKPDGEWIDLVRTMAGSFLLAQSFPPGQVRRAVTAVGEAAERLVDLCVERGATAPYEVGLAMLGQSAHILLSYDAVIPLNPHKEADYEVPEAEDDVTDIDLTGLWLHIIKRSMDRVFFRLNGRRATLAMLLYRRPEEGAGEPWVMGLRPKPGPDVTLDFARVGEDAGAILHDVRSNVVVRLEPSEAFIVRRMDGRRTLFEIYLEHVSERGPISPARIRRLYETLEAARMLDGPPGSTERGAKPWRRWLAPVFSIPRSDAAATRAHRLTRWVMNPFGVAVLGLLGLSGVVPLIRHREEIHLVIPRMLDLLLAQPSLLVAGYAVALLGMSLHEFAHGVTCKHFGGTVRRLGVMWYMGMFFFFCDTTSSWTFPKKSQRIRVSLAGPLVSWACFGAVAWCAGLTASAGGPWFALWTALTLLFGFLLATNLNPLIRMDAYQVLVDWASIPNLQKRAFAWLRAKIPGRFRLTGADATPLPEPTPREERFFAIYGVLSALVSLGCILFPLHRLARLWMTDREFTAWGVVSFAAVVLVLGRLVVRGRRLLHEARRREFRIS